MFQSMLWITSNMRYFLCSSIRQSPTKNVLANNGCSKMLSPKYRLCFYVAENVYAIICKEWQKLEVTNMWMRVMQQSQSWGCKYAGSWETQHTAAALAELQVQREHARMEVPNPDFTRFRLHGDRHTKLSRLQVQVQGLQAQKAHLLRTGNWVIQSIATQNSNVKMILNYHYLFISRK